MKPAIQTLGQILYSPSQYVIPVFQRDYRWETPQWTELWDSLNEIRRSPEEYNALIGAEWKFEQVEGRSRASMFVNHSASDVRNESSWPEEYRWLGEKLAVVYEHIAPRLRKEMDRSDPGGLGSRST